ncbi:MAG: hypothetical protein ACRCWQ_06820 [Bacilli bacterium]
MSRHSTVFAIYKGDDIISVGTTNEVAKQLGISKQTVHCMKSPAHHERTKNKLAAVAYKVDYEEQTVDSMYKRISLRCERTGKGGNNALKREVIEYFQLFKEEFGDKLKQKRIKLTTKG